MPKIPYADINFSKNSLVRIEQANKIIAEYQADGLAITLRQLYYQFVARALLANSERNYKSLGDVVSKGRLCGLIDWDAIEDRTRAVESLSHWDDPTDAVKSIADQYHIDLWQGQPYRVEVWVEKEALAGIVERTANDLDVPFFACRGYPSQSSTWRAGRRMRYYMNHESASPVIIHLGDHDPSGIDMTRDIVDRISMFARTPVEVKRIALNFDQIEEFSPPPNPAKMSDPRGGDYVARFGRSSWELDALDPKTLDRLIREAVEPYINRETMEANRTEQEDERAVLRYAANNWDDIAARYHQEENGEGNNA